VSDEQPYIFGIPYSIHNDNTGQSQLKIYESTLSSTVLAFSKLWLYFDEAV
jgi:hypothetical protein